MEIRDYKDVKDTEIEQKYLATLKQALLLTEEEIKNKRLSKDKYMEAVTRAMFYEGWKAREDKYIADTYPSQEG